ncbi:MAG TPA: agmatine deiminase family protein [Chitinophagaceae bacterium]|nr:agmatine deiminase family protein [Chitinophagaceae bacterium]
MKKIDAQNTASISQTPKKNQYLIPSEFEQQEYIWLSWMESGFLGGEPRYETILNALKEIVPHTKVRLFYGQQLMYNKEQMENRIYKRLIENKVDTARIKLFYNNKAYGAIQDPGPIFLRNSKGEFALADFRFRHPDKTVELIDRNIATTFNLPYISSNMVTEGGGWQTNGKGTILLVEAVELDRNADMSKYQIEQEYKRVLGVTKIIWLKKGLKEEEWGKLENGIYGIGTGGHMDEFCRFTDAHTIILAQVSKEESEKNAIAKESFRRMEENLKILKQQTDQDGKPFKIIRIPTAAIMTKRVAYNNLSEREKTWFDNVTQNSVEFYLTTGYLNFVIANKVIVTSKYWKQGMPEEIRLKDEKAKAVLEKAFPNRNIVQIDCMPLHYDGAGLHCYSRNEPKRKHKVFQ